MSRCLLCPASEHDLLLELKAGNIDGSPLYPVIRLATCQKCGHSFNLLTDSEKKDLNRYYSREYTPTNLGATNLTGDRPGSTDGLSLERYGQLYEVLSPYLKKHHKILDVGCAMGGFLTFLHQRGYNRLGGVDMSSRYIQQAAPMIPFNIRHGQAQALPLQDQTQDVIILDQVLEHMPDPHSAFREANRVLKKGGLFCIGVPDAMRYGKIPFFDFYWLLLREHIQHFDKSHLKWLARSWGFEYVTHHRAFHAVMSPAMQIPNIYAIFKKTKSPAKSSSYLPDKFGLKSALSAYVDRSHATAQNHHQQIASLARQKIPVYIWGIGREFLYLYQNSELRNCRIQALLDSNPFKQQTYEIERRPVHGPNLLAEVSSSAALVITAVAHTKIIEKAAQSIGFGGNSITFETNALKE